MDRLGTKKNLLKRFESLKSERSSFDKEWKDILEFMQPRRGRFNTTDKKQANKSFKKIINSRGTIASRTLAAGLMSGLTSPARPWFKMGTPDEELMSDRRIQEWLRRLEKTMIQVFASGNLYEVLPSVYMELGLVGTGCMSHVDDAIDIARFYPHTVGSYVLASNDRLVVDQMGREYMMDVGQMVSKFGMDAVSQAVRNEYNRGNLNSQHEVFHFVGPNPNYVPDSPLATQMPYMSLYCEAGNTGDQHSFLGISGFNESPFYAPRWEVTEGDSYGTMCPGMAALGDVKGLQVLEKEKAIGIQKKNNPPLKGPGSLRNQPISSIPGGTTLYDGESTGQGLSPVYEVSPDLRETEESIHAHEARIDEAFYADLFKQLANMKGIQPRNELELLQREQEKLLMLGPLLENVQSGLLDPLIDRTANQIFRAGLLPPPPEQLMGQTLRVTYISPLAIAQRQAATDTIDRVVNFVGGVAQLDPQVIDVFDADAAVKEYQVLLDAPVKLLRDDAEVQQIRQQRAQQQQAEQQAALNQVDADTAQKVAQANSA